MVHDLRVSSVRVSCVGVCVERSPPALACQACRCRSLGGVCGASSLPTALSLVWCGGVCVAVLWIELRVKQQSSPSCPSSSSCVQPCEVLSQLH